MVTSITINQQRHICEAACTTMNEGVTVVIYVYGFENGTSFKGLRGLSLC